MRDILDPHSKFHVEVQMVDITPVQRAPVRKEGGDLAISAYPVPHGKAPSLAYRIDAGGRSVVFASDQNGTDAGFAGFARQADVLVLHTGLSAAAQKHPFAKSIGTPQSLAALAAASGAKHVVLSHLMQAPSTDPQAGAFSLFDPNSLLAAVRSTYHGDVSLASDLECVILDK
jgi:ribonuclease BN (tRNA processing enzyme)